MFGIGSKIMLNKKEILKNLEDENYLKKAILGASKKIVRIIIQGKNNEKSKN
jgi:hypothetical protein